MSDNIHIKLPDGSDEEMPKGTTAVEIAKGISPRLAKGLPADQVRQAGFSGKKTIRRVE
jgi:TGS domain